MSNDNDIPLLQDLIRTGDDLKRDNNNVSTNTSNDDLEIDFISEDELSELEHSDPIAPHSNRYEPPQGETPLYEAIKNEAFAKLEVDETPDSVDELPDDLHLEEPVPLGQLNSEIPPESFSDTDPNMMAGPVPQKKEPELYKEDFSNVRELLLDEEIHLILDKHMEQAYQEITRLIKKRT